MRGLRPALTPAATFPAALSMPLPRTITVPLGLAAVALALYAASKVVAVNEPYDAMARDAYRDDDDQAVDAREQAQQARQRFADAARGVVRASAERREADPLMAENEVAAPVIAFTGPVSASDAEAGFDYAMRRVERIAKTRRRLGVDQWHELYREANDAFSAYSVHLDAHDVDQLAMLEDAHRRLKKGLKRVRVRGKKFGPS